MGTTTMNQKEKIMGFSYVFILFAAITVACCSSPIKSGRRALGTKKLKNP
jgi:hypothetical protein